MTTIIGPLVVATVIGLVGDRIRLASQLDDMNAQILTMRLYQKQLLAFKVEGGRFTIEQGNLLKGEMELLVSKCQAAADDIHRMEIAIARLPPDKWQERILELEKAQRTNTTVGTQ